MSDYRVAAGLEGKETVIPQNLPSENSWDISTAVAQISLQPDGMGNGAEKRT